MFFRILSLFGLKKNNEKIYKGKRGEQIAENYLKKKGFKILEKNFRVKGGEADLIAQFDEKIVVVEVKLRTTKKFGTPHSAVNRRKFKRLLLAGTIYCRKKNLSTRNLRIDIVSIEINNSDLQIRHFENVNLL